MTLDQLSSSYHLSVLAPEISLTLFALAVLLAGAFFPDAAQRRFMPLLALSGVAVSAAGTYALWNRGLVFGPTDKALQDAGHAAIYAADNFSLFFKWIFLLGLAISILISGRFLSARSGDQHTVIGEYFGLMMLCTVGMMFVAGARDLLVVFLGIETLSIALYVLAGFARRRVKSNEAALKYFLLGAFASGFLLYGIALIYYAIGSTSFDRIIGSGGVPREGISSAILYAGVAFVLIGLCFKAALVPFHQWTPDVYEGAPTPVTAFMAVGAKAAAFAAFLRIFPHVFGSIEGVWHSVVLVIAVLTMTVGNIVAISQNSLKRMLAYSSVAHAGYLLIGVVAAGNARRMNSQDGARDATAGVLFYLVSYAVMNLGAFALLVYLESRRDQMRGTSEATDGSDSEDGNIRLGDLSGLAWRDPLAAAALTIFLVSLAGIPPTAGFFGKLYIFRAAIEQGLIGLVLVAVLNTVISIYYYLRPIISMYSAQGDETATRGLATHDVVIDGATSPAGAMRVSSSRSAAVSMAIGLCLVSVIAMTVLQAVVFPWAQQASEIVRRP